MKLQSYYKLQHVHIENTCSVCKKKEVIDEGDVFMNDEIDFICYNCGYEKKYKLSVEIMPV